MEFARVYYLSPGKNGTGGSYILYSGNYKFVRLDPSICSDAILINHTYPRGSAFPSPVDLDLIKVLQDLGSPQKVSEIIPIGKDYTVFYIPEGLKP